MAAETEEVPVRTGSPISADASRCAGCQICALRCSLRFEKAFNPAMAAITVSRLVGEAHEYAIAFGPACDNCGICARYCAYGALTQEGRRSAS